MAWKRSTVRTRPGPPSSHSVTATTLPSERRDDRWRSWYARKKDCCLVVGPVGSLVFLVPYFGEGIAFPTGTVLITILMIFTVVTGRSLLSSRGTCEMASATSCPETTSPKIE